jgi:hypothetical protein
MAVIVQLLNGTNQCRDAGFQAEKTAILTSGVRKNYLNELAVTTGQVDTGMAFIEVTRDAVTPNEVFMIPVWVTAATVVTTTGDGYIILRIDKDKVNDGSANAADGSGIATLEKVATLVGITDDYLVLATLASGVITDARDWAQISTDVIEDPLYYDEDVGANDSYAISVSGVKAYIDGQRYTFKANTANTGAATLNVNSLGAKSIRKDFDSVLSDNDIDAGQIIDVIYDADNDWFQMQSPLANSPTTLNKATTGDAQAGTDDDKYMTPAKTKDAIDALSGNVKVYTFGEAIDGTTTPQACYLAAADGKVYKTDANDASKEKTFKFIGFTRENVSMNATGEVIETGEVDGFSGLTTNSDLYLSDTAGAISHTPSTTNYYKIARATSATTLIIEKDIKIALIDSNAVRTAESGTSGTTTGSFTVATPCRARLIEFDITLLAGEQSGSNGTSIKTFKVKMDLINQRIIAKQVYSVTGGNQTSPTIFAAGAANIVDMLDQGGMVAFSGSVLSVTDGSGSAASVTSLVSTENLITLSYSLTAGGGDKAGIAVSSIVVLG